MIGPVILKHRRKSLMIQPSFPPALTLARISRMLLQDSLPHHNEEDDINLEHPTDIFLKLDIGGVPYRIQSETILKREGTFLRRFLFKSHENRLIRADDYDAERNEYFFERSSQLFDPIYRYYITGVCHRPFGVCTEEFLAELRYWDVTNLGHSFAICCWPEADEEADVEKFQDFDNVAFSQIRKKIWDVLEEPQSSLIARMVNILSILAVIASNIGMILGSMAAFQVPNPENVKANKHHPFLDHMEFVCVMWFTIEYVTKMVIAVERFKVFIQPMNIVDLVTIFPFYFELSLTLIGLGENKLGNLKSALLALRILRALRICRIFKLGKYSSGVQIFAKTIYNSLNQLAMLSLVVVTGIVFFSTLIYFIEKDEIPTDFPTIPAGFWWCIVTMSSAGYGDATPRTAAGKLVATAAVISGMLVLVLPITIVAENYMQVTDEKEAKQMAMDAEEHHHQATGFARRKNANKQGIATVAHQDVVKSCTLMAMPQSCALENH